MLLLDNGGAECCGSFICVWEEVGRYHGWYIFKTVIITFKELFFLLWQAGSLAILRDLWFFFQRCIYGMITVFSYWFFFFFLHMHLWLFHVDGEEKSGKLLLWLKLTLPFTVHLSSTHFRAELLLHTSSVWFSTWLFSGLGFFSCCLPWGFFLLASLRMGNGLKWH